MAKAASKRIESKVVDYAEELGRLLGTVRGRIDTMGLERRKLVQQLTTVVKDAQGLLSELGRSRGRKTKKPRSPATTRQKTRKRRGAKKARS